MSISLMYTLLGYSAVYYVVISTQLGTKSSMSMFSEQVLISPSTQYMIVDPLAPWFQKKTQKRKYRGK